MTKFFVGVLWGLATGASIVLAVCVDLRFIILTAPLLAFSIVELIKTIADAWDY